MRRLAILCLVLLATFSLSLARIIKIGSSMGLTGPYADIVQQLNNGINMAFKDANTKRLLGKDRLVFVVYDDGYNAANTVVNLEKLYRKDKVDFLFAVFGTPSSIAAAERLEYYNWLLFFPVTGFSELYYGELAKNVFTLLPSYEHEGEQLTELAAKNGVKSIGVVYFSNLYGFDVLQAAEFTAKKHKMKVFKYSFMPTKATADIASQILKR